MHCNTHQHQNSDRESCIVQLQTATLIILDFHPDDFYQPRTSTEEGIACHRGNGLAGTYGAEKTDCDSPFSLVNATFDWVEEHLKDDIDFIIWTGDSARHDSDEEYPRNTAEVLRTNQELADKFVHTFSSKEGGLEIPIIPTLGNNDFLPHNIFFPGPNKWLHSYSNIWNRFIPEEQRHTFEFGGWFYVEVIPNNLAVFSLNTMYFFDRNAGVDGCENPNEPGYLHLEWLRVQLQILRDRKMKAILTGHVPPARTDSKSNWDETCWQKYTLWLNQFRDVVTASVYGHMNIDHFFLSDTKEVNINSEDPVIEAKTRGSLDEDDKQFSTQSKADYLLELRQAWGDLPGKLIKSLAEDDEEEQKTRSIFELFGKKGKDKKGKKGKKGKKKDKYKKLGGKYAERYHLTMVSPSVVPNYFPSLRVVEYNITGLEDAPSWKDYFGGLQIDAGKEQQRLELRDVEEWTKGKKDKNLHIPKDPAKKDLPGPAYFPQTLTLTGYTQYFANLTHINNDLGDPEAEVDGLKWRKGAHDNKKPKYDDPTPRDFNFEVEYSTFDDKTYKLKDLTVKSFVKLAYRIGKQPNAMKETSEDCDEEEEEDDDDEVEEYTIDAQGKKHKKHKKKKKDNKVWRTFLSRAFVGSKLEEELED